MPYYRTRSYRNRRPYLRPTMPSRSKYSIEQKSFSLVSPTTGPVNGLYQSTVQVVEPITVQGMRKVKHLMVNLASFITGSADGSATIYWALVYVPQGTNVGALNLNNSMYEPNQYVMNCGVVDASAGPLRFTSPISRNLNSGDAIYLVLGTTGATANTNLQGVVKYAITLN